jgi:beta-lactam-binding protein with PASTA domain
MSKIRDFFRPQRMGFHLLLAIVVTIVIVFIANVLLDVYTNHGEEIEIPNYIGQPSSDLINGETGDFVFVIGSTSYNKDCPDGTVLEQDPRPGEQVKKGRKVYLTCSSVIPPKVAMPQLAGDITLRQAATILENSGLELGAVTYVQSDYVGLVLQQYYKGRPIAKGTMINIGEKITLEVGALVQPSDSIPNEEDELFDN